MGLWYLVVFLSLCLAAVMCDYDAAEKADQRRISDLGNCVRKLWTDLRITVCVVLPVCGSEVCACLLDQRTALGCGALYREFCTDADAWKAVV